MYNTYSYSYSYATPTANQKPNDLSWKFRPNEVRDGKILAVTATLLGWIGIMVALMCDYNRNRYTRFFTRQCVKIQLCKLVSYLFLIVPIVGHIVFAGTQIVTTIASWYMLVVAVQGGAKEPPIIKKLGFLKPL